MTTPVRIRLSRQRGFDLQAHSRAINGLPAVVVTRASDAGNPFTITACREAGYAGTDAEIAARCVESFRVWIDTPLWRNNWDGEESAARREKARAMLPYLRGKNLACACALDAPCHADVLLEIANRPICEAVE
jgi:hypothetical protein